MTLTGMEFGKDTWWLVLLLLGFVTSAVTYLIKTALFNKLDKLEVQVSKLKDELPSKEEYLQITTELKKDIDEIKSNYTRRDVHIKDFDECRQDIKKIRDDYITKEDFLRENAKVDRKLDKIMDILMERKSNG